MPRYFDEDLPRVGADKLKKMNALWGGNNKMRKDDGIACISNGLKDHQKVRAAVANLKPWERNALALIKRMGGTIPSHTLKIGILASGLHPPRSYGYRDDLIEHLLHRGLLLVTGSYSPDYLESYSYRSSLLYSDERLLVPIGQPECLPLEIRPIQPSGEAHFRRPSAIALDVMGILHAIENMGGLRLTQNGTVRVSDEAKLRKAMRWDEKGMEIEGFLFPNPVHAWLSAFGYSDLLQKTEGGLLVLKESPEHFASRPFSEQIRLLLEGFLRMDTWWEASIKNSYFDNDGKGRSQGRMAITMALTALPLNPESVYSIRDFDKALYQRIGEDFALDYPPNRPSYYRSTDAARQKQELLQWQETTRSDWLKQEFPWLVGAFTTWLYFMGLVELFVDNGQLAGFRLTDTGRVTFHPELATVTPEEPSAQTENQPAWVVQPNFDIIAYLERVSAPQLAFLERHAERTASHKHTAHYRLTRESVYRGLESGTKLEELVHILQTGSQAELAQNVLVELREWAGLRERILLRREARLLEFASPHALQTSLEQGLKGSIVAGRFLLLEPDAKVPEATSIDYAKPLPKNLTATETGLIGWKRIPSDLVTAAQLDQWAEVTADDSWQITRTSVTKALKPGKKLTELLDLLNNRLKPSLPPLLDLALRSWAGASYPIELESVIVLRCRPEKVFQVLISSPLMISYWKGYIYPDLLFVEREQLEPLRERLQWLGWQISERLNIIPIGKHSP